MGYGTRGEDIDDWRIQSIGKQIARNTSVTVIDNNISAHFWMDRVHFATNNNAPNNDKFIVSYVTHNISKNAESNLLNKSSFTKGRIVQWEWNFSSIQTACSKHSPRPLILNAKIAPHTFYESNSISTDNECGKIRRAFAMHTRWFSNWIIKKSPMHSTGIDMWTTKVERIWII